MKWLAVVALLFVVAGLGADSTSGQDPPGLSVDVRVSDNAAGANSDVTVDVFTPVTYPTSQEYFFPASWGVADDGAVPDGVVRAAASVQLVIRLMGACSGTSPDDPVNYDWQFELLDATTSMLSSTGGTDQLADSDNDGIPNGVESYPANLKAMSPGVTPRARLWGATTAPGMPGRPPFPFAMHVLVFDPGDYRDVSADWTTSFPADFGYAFAVTFEYLRYPNEPGTGWSSCLRAASIRHHGSSPAGEPLLTNPAAGVYGFAFHREQGEDPGCAFHQTTVGEGGIARGTPDCPPGHQSNTLSPTPTPSAALGALPDTGGPQAASTAWWKELLVIVTLIVIPTSWAAMRVLRRC